MPANKPRTIEVNLDWEKIRVFRWVIPIFIAIWAVLSTYYTVPADSVGILQRFGAYYSTQKSGLHFKLPFGIDSVSIVPTGRQLKLEFGFRTAGATNTYQTSDEPELESSMVTGDLNAAVVEWVVQYHIDDPKHYLFHARDPELTLRDLSEAAMREVVGDRTVDEVITIGRQEIEVQSREKLSQFSKMYELGLVIDQVQLKNVDPPRPVQASFNEVNKAQQDKENMINLANGEYNKAVPRAKGEAEQKISIAEGYKTKRVNEALGDVSAFNAVLTQYLKAPAITRARLYLETMGEVLPKIPNKTIVDEKVTQLIPLLSGGKTLEGIK
jgi:modulator of FtsH protease HflK